MKARNREVCVCVRERERETERERERDRERETLPDPQHSRLLSISLTYEPASEPLHISVNWLFSKRHVFS